MSSLCVLLIDLDGSLVNITSSSYLLWYALYSTLFLLFYVFWEAMMIPLYILIGVWGGPGRVGATIKFVIYTLAGSLLMLVSVIALGLSAGTFDMREIGESSSTWIFLGFAAAFAVASLLTILAVVTLIARSLIEWRAGRRLEAGASVLEQA